MLNVLGLISSAQSIVVAFMVGNLTDIATNKNYSIIPRFFTVVLVTFFITFIAELIFNRLKTDAIQTANTTFRIKIFKGMINRSTEENTDALSFLTNDFKLLETNRFNSEIEIFINFYTLILALGYAIYLSWTLTIIVLVGSFLPMIASGFFQKPIQNASEDWSNSNNKYVNHTKNFLAGTDTFKLYGRQNEAVAKNA